MNTSPTTFNLSPSPARLKYHFERYFPTLIEYEQYRSLIFSPGEEMRPHFAYVCPLCLKNVFFVIKDDNLYATTEFDEDHFPPDSVGGRNTILVCKPCNSTAGTDVDYTLKEGLQHRSYAAGYPHSTLPMRAKISTIPGNYKGAISMDLDQRSAIDIYHNKNTALLNQWMEGAKDDLNYTIELTVFKPEGEKFAKSLLKAAYLYCFQFWGYSFAYSRSGELIRKVLASEIEYPIEDIASFQFENTTINLPEGIFFISEPTPWRTYAVNIPVQLKETGYRCIFTVLIPPPTEHGWEELAGIGELLKSKPESSITMVKMINRYEEMLAQKTTVSQGGKG